MRYRSRTDITAQVLEAANGGATKTKVMYGAMLSFAQLKEYLIILIDNGLLDYDSNTGKYKTTSKGWKFLEVYGEMGKLAEIKLEPEVMNLNAHRANA